MRKRHRTRYKSDHHHTNQEDMHTLGQTPKHLLICSNVAHYPLFHGVDFTASYSLCQGAAELSSEFARHMPRLPFPSLLPETGDHRRRGGASGTSQSRSTRLGLHSQIHACSPYAGGQTLRPRDGGHYGPATRVHEESGRYGHHCSLLSITRLC